MAGRGARGSVHLRWLALLILLAGHVQGCSPAYVKVADAYRDDLPDDFTRFELFGDRIDTNLAGWNATYYRANATWVLGGPFWVDHGEERRMDASACNAWASQYATPTQPKEPRRNPLFALQAAAWNVKLQHQLVDGAWRIVAVNVTWSAGAWHADAAPEGPACDVALVHTLGGYLLLDPARDRALSLPTVGASLPREVALTLPGFDGVRTVRDVGPWPLILHPQAPPTTLALDGSAHAFPFASWDKQLHGESDVVVGVNGTLHWLRLDGGWKTIASAPDPGVTLDNWVQNRYPGGWFMGGERTFVWRNGEPAPREVPWAGRVAFAHHGAHGIWAKGDAIYQLDPVNLTVSIIERPATPTGPHPAVAGTGYLEPLRGWPPARPVQAAPSTSGETNSTSQVPEPTSTPTRNAPPGPPAMMLLAALASACLARRRTQGSR